MNTENSKFIISGAPIPSNFLDGFESLGEYIIQRFENNKNKILLINGLTEKKLTALDLLKKSISVAECLQNYGIKRGDKIGISCENRFEFYYLLFGTIFLGATLTPFNTTYTERELCRLINLSKPRLIFTSSLNAKVFQTIRNKNSYIEDIIVFDENEKHHNNSFAQFINKFQINDGQNVSFKCNSENIHENVSLILYSSGTTGLPKGVQITQYNILITIAQDFQRQRDAPIEKKLCPEPIGLSIAPMFHSYGCMLSLVMACVYYPMVFLPKFEEKLFLQSIQKYRVDTAYLVPPLVVFLAKHPMVDNYDLSSLKIVWCGSSSLKSDMEAMFKTRIGIQFMRQAFGLTEITLALTTQTDFYQKPGSVGVLRAGVKAKVICTETGRILGPNQRGELLFQSGTTMKGYVDDEETTKNTIDKDGWLHTGDVGYYDKDGEFFIIERLKELIKYKGYQVAPAEIEGILLQHPDIADAAVIGLPDELAGELPLAFVVKKPNVNLTEKEIVDFVASNVSYAKRLHGGVIFINEIPKNPIGKILRRILRESLQNVKSKL